MVHGGVGGGWGAVVDVLVSGSAHLVMRKVANQSKLFRTEGVGRCKAGIMKNASPNGKKASTGNVPIFGAVCRTIRRARTGASVVFIPTHFTTSTVVRTTSTNVQLVIYVTRNVPALSIVGTRRFVGRGKTVLINPGYPKLVSPKGDVINVLPKRIFRGKGINIVDHDNALACRVMCRLATGNVKRSATVNVNNSPMMKLRFHRLLRVFRGSARARTVILVNRVNKGTRRRTTRCVHGRMAGPIMTFVTKRSTPLKGRVKRTKTVVSKASNSTGRGVRTLRTTNVRITRRPSSVPTLLGTTGSAAESVLGLQRRRLMSLRLRLGGVISSRRGGGESWRGRKHIDFLAHPSFCRCCLILILQRDFFRCR